VAPAEGEQECLKIQLEKGPLANLVEVFLGVTQGFTVPAGAIAFWLRPASLRLLVLLIMQQALSGPPGPSGGLRWVSHGIPLLLG
jgi:hypothetical protein